MSAALHLWLSSSRCSQEGRGNPTNVADTLRRHHVNLNAGESHSWKCYCTFDASGRVGKMQTELRLEMMCCQHGSDSW